MHPLNTANAKPGFKEIVPSTTDYSHTQWEHGSEGTHPARPGFGSQPALPEEHIRTEPGSGKNSASSANSAASRWWASATKDSVPEGVDVPEGQEPEGGMSHLKNSRSYGDFSRVANARRQAAENPNRAKRYPADTTPEESLAQYGQSKTYGKFLPSEDTVRGRNLN